MKYGSVCSGIEAASIAWEPLGFSPAWFSEIEKFPSAVLKHHWPDVENHGDMTKLPNLIANRLIESPDIIVGGTPCQSFSVAGLRKGLEDDRGNLTLKFVELCNATDANRLADGREESIIVWENVPGVLSSKDNAFGCFLGALAGEDKPVEPAGKKWTNAGCVFAPQRAIAWRVLDAQYFGLAQRRKRVFVVASARAGFDPAAVLFEFDGVRRDTPPCRETGQDFADDVARSARTSGSHGEVVGALCARDYKGVGNQFVSEGKLMIAKPYEPVAKCLNAGGMGRQDYESESFVCHPIHDKATRHAGATGKGSGNGLGVGKDGDPCPTLTVGDKHAVAIQGSMIGRNDKNGPQGNGLNDEVSFTLNATDRHAVAVHGTQDPIVGDNRAHALWRNNGAENAVFSTGETTLNEVTMSLTASYGQGGADLATKPMALYNAAVRRLTPTECARLQGFPDDHCRIPWRGKPAEQCPDGPQYKAYGNSMAVNVMRWIGKRIKQEVGE